MLPVNVFQPASASGRIASELHCQRQMRQSRSNRERHLNHDCFRALAVSTGVPSASVCEAPQHQAVWPGPEAQEAEAPMCHSDPTGSSLSLS